METKGKKKGFTLIELIVVIAILGILAAIMVPKLTGFRDSANDRTDEANAKLLTNVAQMVMADRGSYPSAAEWPDDDEFTVAECTFNLKEYIPQTITHTGGTNFDYDPATGVVTP